MTDATAFVIAGGKSSRMGTDKAFLVFKGETLLAKAIDVASVAGRVRIVGNPQKFGKFGETIEDLFPGQGPLAGIHAALKSSASELNLMLAVDMPFVTREMMHFLMKRACDAGKTVTVPRAGGRLQPLCAVYRRDFCDVAEHALVEGRNKIEPLFGLDLTYVVEESELVEAGFSPSMFDNLNTAEEFQRACSSVRGSR